MLSIFLSLRSWWKQVRPKTLVACWAPVLMVHVYHYKRVGVPDILDSALLFLTAFLIQISCNWVNDYYDFKKGTDDKRLGEKRSLHNGELDLNQIKIGIGFLFVGVLFLAGYFGFSYGFIFFLIIMLCYLVGFIYTGGPFPLAYNGLGDIFAFVFFGPVISYSTAAILNGGIFFSTIPLFVIALVTGIFSLMLIIVNNYRDRETDLEARKKTLAVLLGANYCKSTYVLCAVFLLCMPVVLWALEVDTIFQNFFGVSLLASPLLLYNSFQIHVKTGGQLNAVLASTGICYALYGLLFCFAILTNDTFS